MLRTSMGQLLINEALPEDMRDHDRVLDKKGMNALLRELAQKHPDKYVEVSKKLNDIGRTVATEFGGYTFGLEHLAKSQVAKKNQLAIRGKMKQILDRDDLSPEQRNDLIVKMVGGYQQKQIDDIYDESVKANNPLALQVVSGSRGNKMNLGSLLGSDMLYSDHRDRVIPLPVLRSYSEGLTPIEYWASTYGARRGTMATKFATQDAGFLSKQLNQVAHRLMVVDEDDPRDLPDRGLPVDTDDGDNEGSLLAKDIGPYKRNTVLSPKILKHLKGLGHDRILVRSPLVGGSPDGGVYSRDVGVRERGVLPGRGEQVGLTAAQALSEPLSQGQLSAKHSGGVAGQEKAVGGFAYINQLIQTPKKGKGWAAHSDFDGRVTNVEEAPAGGFFVYVGDHKHYVPAGNELKVKKGDEIEAGDVLSDGFPNPSIVTHHKGVGEGKRYFVNAMRQAMNDAGMKCNRRNVELLARGLINHVRLTDEYGDNVPDDVVPYSTMEHVWEPREDHQVLRSERALGKYLEKPVLHYSVGTKIRPSVLKELQHFGVGEIAVHDEPPPFQPEMIRGMYSLQNDPDWMTRMYGSGLKESLTEAVHRGRVSDEQGTSFVPGLARAVEFGRTGSVRAPEPGIKPPPEGQPFGDPRNKTSLPPKPAKPSVSIMPEKEEPKKTGFFSGMFKLSEDMEKDAATAQQIMNSKPVKQTKAAGGLAKQVMKIRQTRLTKTADDPMKPKVDTTTPANTGSSTAAPATTTATPLGTPPPQAGGVPHPGATPGAVPGPAVNTSIMPPTPPSPSAGSSTPPGAATPSAPTGQVNPLRMPSKPWAGGVATYEGSPGQNPNAFNEGYTPGHGMMSGMEDPSIMHDFVQGGGNDADPHSGFGGQFGKVTRFGSLLDTRAVATLTAGQSGYAPNEQDHGGYHDDLLGGSPPRLDLGPNLGPQGWGAVSDRPGGLDPWHGTSGPAQPPVPAGQPPAGSVPPPVPKPAVNGPAIQLTNKNHFRDAWMQGSGIGPGHAEYEAAKAKIGPTATNDQIADLLYSRQRKAFALEKAGLKPGTPKFEETRKLAHAALVKRLSDEGVADIPGTTQKIQGKIAELQAADPNDPQIAELQKVVKILGMAQTGQLDPADVFDYAMEHDPTDPNSISEFDMSQEMQGKSGTTHDIMKAYLSPVTGGTAWNATKGLLKGGWQLLRSKPAEKAVEKGTLKVLGQAAKPLAKKVPVLGWILEGREAYNTPADELKAKYNKNYVEQDPTSLKGLGNNAKDIVLNPGTHLASAAEALNDAGATFQQGRYTAHQTDLNQASHLIAQIQWLEGRGRQLTPGEQERLTRSKAKLEEIKGNYTGFNGKLKGVDDWDKEMKYRVQRAEATAKQARVVMGEQAAQAVLEGRPTPEDLDHFEEYMQSLTGVESMLDDRTAFDDKAKAKLAVVIPRMADLAEKMRKAGNNPVADRLDAVLKKFGGNTPEAWEKARDSIGGAKQREHAKVMFRADQWQRRMRDAGLDPHGYDSHKYEVDDAGNVWGPDPAVGQYEFKDGKMVYVPPLGQPAGTPPPLMLGGLGQTSPSGRTGRKIILKAGEVNKPNEFGFGGPLPGGTPQFNFGGTGGLTPSPAYPSLGGGLVRPGTTDWSQFAPKGGKEEVVPNW